MIGAFSAIVSLMNSRISEWDSMARSRLTMSILFWTTTMFSIPAISSAARCSRVWGCGHFSVAATSSRAPSIIDAPEIITAMSVS